MADEMIIVGFPLSIAGIIKAGLGQEMKQYSDLRSLPQSLSHVSVCSWCHAINYTRHLPIRFVCD
jgi:hypothetical protein